MRLAFCSHEAAKHAVMRWHYSRKMPAGKVVKIGSWEGKTFVGVVLYGSGANNHLARPFDVAPRQACELVRVALSRRRKVPTSRILGISLKMLRRSCPGLRVVVSYADQGQGHLGTIYQATNWVYLGPSVSKAYIRLFGDPVHARCLYDRYGRGNGQSVEWLRANVDPNAEWVEMPPKHKYAYPLDDAMRSQLAKEALKFPRKDDKR